MLFLLNVVLAGPLRALARLRACRKGRKRGRV